MAAVHKKTANAEPPKKAETQSVKEPVVVSDVVTQTTERIEVIEETIPEPKSEKETPAKSESAATETPSEASADPLTDFKEKMSEEEESPVYSEPAKKNYMWPILFIFIIALLMLGGIFVYKNNMKNEKVNVTTLTPTPTIIPEPTKAVDLTKYEIKVLNGSEVDGEAGRQKTSLEGEGFTVSEIGNAETSDYTKTIIQAKETVESAFLEKLKNVLESSFVVGDSEELPQDSDSDVIVILGSQTN